MSRFPQTSAAAGKEDQTVTPIKAAAKIDVFMVQPYLTFVCEGELTNAGIAGTNPAYAKLSPVLVAVSSTREADPSDAANLS